MGNLEIIMFESLHSVHNPASCQIRLFKVRYHSLDQRWIHTLYFRS